MVFYVLSFLVATIITWVILLIVVPIAQKLADFGMPPWPEALWKLAVISGGVNLVSLALDPIHWLLAIVASAIVFWVLMVKWFQVDFFGAVIIVAIGWIVRSVLMIYLLGALAALS